MAMRSFIPGIILIGLLCSGCSKDASPTSPPTDPPLQLQKLSDTTAQGVRIELWAESAPDIGPCRLHVALVDPSTGHRIRGGAVTVTPKMLSPGLPHGTAFELLPANDSLATYPALVVCTMIGTWQLHVVFDTKAGQAGAVNLPFPVIAGTRAKIVLGSDGDPYIVALMRPRTAIIGLNPSEVLLYHQTGTYTYPPVTVATVTLEPFMPAMGHGSPANVDPVHTALGHYVGTVNFTMLGDWRLDFRAVLPGGSENGTTIVASFNITL